MKKQNHFTRFSLIRIFTVIILTNVLMAPATSWCKGRLFLGVPGGKGGVVTTSVPDAARVGAEILKQGGNAIDAAAAVQFALNVVEPYFSGIGGGGFMVIYLAKKGKTVTVESREKAPAAADPEMFVPFFDFGNQAFNLASTSGSGGRRPGDIVGSGHSLKKMGDYQPE